MYLSRGTDRVNGVALRNDNRVSHSLIEWNPVSNRILTARIRQIVVYAPTEKTPVADNSSFYNHLESLVSSTPPCDQIVILGEFNAVIGTNRASYESVIGNFARAASMTFQRGFWSCVPSKILLSSGLFSGLMSSARPGYLMMVTPRKNEIYHMLTKDQTLFTSYRVIQRRRASSELGSPPCRQLAL